MPPPLGGGVLHSFFFTAVRPIGLGSSFIFLRCPEEKRTKKKGGAEREKNSAYGLKQLFPRRETSKTASSELSIKGYIRSQSLKTASPGEKGPKTVSTNHRDIKIILFTRQGKESGLWLLTTFPGAGNAGGGAVFIVVSSIHYINGAARKPAGRREFVCKPCPFLLNKRGGRLTREKLSERSEFFSHSGAPFFW